MLDLGSKELAILAYSRPQLLEHGHDEVAAAAHGANLQPTTGRGGKAVDALRQRIQLLRGHLTKLVQCQDVTSRPSVRANCRLGGEEVIPDSRCRLLHVAHCPRSRSSLDVHGGRCGPEAAAKVGNGVSIEREGRRARARHGAEWMPTLSLSRRNCENIYFKR